jgi:hypothetical protein
MQRINAVVGILLCTALAVGVLSLGVAGEPKEAPVKLYEGQIKSIKIDKCGLEPGTCEGSIVLAPRGGGEQMVLAIQPGTWIQRGDNLVLLEDLGVGNYLKVRSVVMPGAMARPGTVGSSPGERPYLLEETGRGD